MLIIYFKKLHNIVNSVFFQEVHSEFVHRYLIFFQVSISLKTRRYCCKPMSVDKLIYLILYFTTLYGAEFKKKSKGVKLIF